VDWVALCGYGAGGAAGGVAGWLSGRRFPRWRFELRVGLFVAGLLLAGALVVPRLAEGRARAELRAAGLQLFGDAASAEHYARRLLPIRSDARLADKAEAIAARLSPGRGAGSSLATVSYTGMARLSLSELETSLAVRRRMADSSPVVCAGLWKGGIASADLAAALRGLSTQDKQSWIDLTARATTLELAADGPAAGISSVQAGMAWSILMARLPESGRAVIERVSKDGAAASPDDACQAFRIVASEAAALTPEARDTLLRVVTCPFLVVNG
jgi:hypothetical protein